MGEQATMVAPVPAGRALVLGRYRIRRRLGSGAHGTVHLAHDERLARDVAVKVVPLDRAGGARAEREVAAAARLAHPGIVTLYEAADDGEHAYLVSELVRGRTLAHLMDAGLLSDRDVARIGVALADALAHAHAHGVVHRDVKPANVMVPDEPQSGPGLVKLTDFGVARLAGAEALTRTGDVVGTLAYMAPEQAEGRAAGPAADLYALALVLHEALCGRNPVRAASPAATARRVGSRLPSLARARPDLPEPLVAALDRALDPDPAVRGGTADLRRALAAAAPDLEDEPGLPAPRGRRPLRRRAPRPAAGRLAAAGAAGVLAGAVIALLAPAPPPGGPATAGAAVALAVALLPRVGWLLGAALAIGWTAASGRPGAALLVLVAVAPVPLLLPGAPSLWSVPGAAPALGAAGLAGAWPGPSSLAGGAWRRAVLAALGYVWVALTELLSGAHLYMGPPPGAGAPASWSGDVAQAATHALLPLARSGLLAGAAVWALAAAVLPWLVRGRSLEADVVLAAAWAGALSAGASAAARLAGAAAAAPPRGAVLGALAGAATAVALRRLRPPRARAGTGAVGAGGAPLGPEPTI